MAERQRLLYICIKDDPPEKDSSSLRQAQPRYTRSILSNTLQLMGCKPRHAFKISNRAFEILARLLSAQGLKKDSAESGFSKMKISLSVPAGLDVMAETESNEKNRNLNCNVGGAHIEAGSNSNDGHEKSECDSREDAKYSCTGPVQSNTSSITGTNKHTSPLVAPEYLKVEASDGGYVGNLQSNIIPNTGQVSGVAETNSTREAGKLLPSILSKEPESQKAKRRSVQISRMKFLDIVCQALAEYHYVGPNQRSDLMIACRLREHRTSVIVLLCGTSGCGKSTLSSLLASRLGITTVVSTDSIRHMMRSFASEQENPLLWASTYHAGEFLDPVAVAEAKAKKRSSKPSGVQNSSRSNSLPSSNSVEIETKDECVSARQDGKEEKRDILEASITEKELAVQGFKAQCEMVIDSLDRLITRWEKQRESAIVEGVHLSLNFVMTLMKKHPSIIPFMVYISDETKHLERFAVRAKYMTLDPARNKYVKYIRNIRTIQDYLCKRADKHLVPKVNNTNVDKSVAAIHATVFACLRRCAAGEILYDQIHNTVPGVFEEYQSQYAASDWSSKGMFQLIQLQGAHRNSLSLVHNHGPITKLWPVSMENTGGVLVPMTRKLPNGFDASVPMKSVEPNSVLQSLSTLSTGGKGVLMVHESGSGQKLKPDDETLSTEPSQKRNVDNWTVGFDAQGNRLITNSGSREINTDVYGTGEGDKRYEQLYVSVDPHQNFDNFPMRSPRPVDRSRAMMGSNNPQFVPKLVGPGSPVHVRFGGHGLNMCTAEPGLSSTYSSSVEGTSTGGIWPIIGSCSSTDGGAMIGAHQRYSDEAVAMSESDEEEESASGSDEDYENDNMLQEAEEGSVDEDESFMQSDDEQGLSGDEHDDEGGWFDGEEDGLDDGDTFYFSSRHPSPNCIYRQGEREEEVYSGANGGSNSGRLKNIDELSGEPLEKHMRFPFGQGLLKSMSSSSISERQQRRHSDGGKFLLSQSRLERESVGGSIEHSIQRRHKKGVMSRSHGLSSSGHNTYTRCSCGNDTRTKNCFLGGTGHITVRHEGHLDAGDLVPNLGYSILCHDNGVPVDANNGRRQEHGEYADDVGMSARIVNNKYPKSNSEGGLPLRDNCNTCNWRASNGALGETRKVNPQPHPGFRKRAVSSS